ncbi:MAG: transposase [Myxococcales bacterium]|nr:transposase [Myxococcales bacterium]
MPGPIQQPELPFRTRGGRRPGAGRPVKAGSESHRRRPPVSAAHPLHVTLRVAQHVWNLRAQRCLRPIDAALRALHSGERARVTHFSVQGNHVHLVVEARDGAALSSAMRSLTIRIARGLNEVMGRRGRVLASRYHARALRSPTEARNVLRYVLANHARHVPGAPVADPWSSAPVFSEWKAVGLPAATVHYALPGHDPPVARPESWLLRTGFRRPTRKPVPAE